ncbi:acyltransferase [Sphingopyxis kveilinensis]|uniref:acyltransferase n=1 Tax=Sphingopyxis kveilinensis TaxID=3114367 RepID=UPI0030CDC6B0
MSRAKAAYVSKPLEHIDYLDPFRAFAILQVVLIHGGNALLLRGLPSLDAEGSAAYALLHIIAHDSTIYFAVISGVLYGHLFWRRDHRVFMQGRLAKIGLPYTVITLVLTTLFWTVERLKTGSDADLPGLVVEFCRNIAFGDAWNTMWYIPVILVLYLISPILWALQNRPEMRWILAVIIILPIIATRTGTMLTPQIFLYFLGSYTAGMWIGTDTEKKIDLLSKHVSALLLTLLGASLLLGWMFARQIDMWGVVSLRESVFYIQRLAASALVLIWFRQWVRRGISPRIRSISEYLAVASFGIYFVHGPLLRPIARLIGSWVSADQRWWVLAAAILATMIAGLLLSILIVEGVRRIVPKHAKRLIGA